MIVEMALTGYCTCEALLSFIGEGVGVGRGWSLETRVNIERGGGC